MVRHRAEWGTPYVKSRIQLVPTRNVEQLFLLKRMPHWLPSPSVYRVDAWWGMAEGLTSWYLTVGLSVWLSVCFYDYECSHTMHMQCPQKPEGIGYPSIRVTDSFKVPCGSSGSAAAALSHWAITQPQADAFEETLPSSKNKDSKGIWVVGCSSADACVVTQCWLKLGCF